MTLFAVNFATMAQDATEETVTAEVVAVAEEAVEAVAEVAPAIEAVATEAVIAEENIDLGETFANFFHSMGLTQMVEDPRYLIMIVIACLLFYLAIVKQFEPLLLLPIAFGMLLTNLPGAGLFHEELFAGGHVHWSDMANGAGLISRC